MSAILRGTLAAIVGRPKSTHDEGAAMAEYVLLVVGIAVVVAAAAAAFGDRVTALFDGVSL